MQKLIALAKFEKDEKLMAEKIRQLRDLRNAFKEMGIEFPEFLFGAIFVQCMEFGSFIREKLTSHMNDAWEKNLELDFNDMIDVWQVWNRDQKQQRALSAGGGK